LLDPNWVQKKRLPGDQSIAWPKAEEASRAVREYLAVLDAARSDERVAAEMTAVRAVAAVGARL
jgi:hypothetical protein